MSGTIDDHATAQSTTETTDVRYVGTRVRGGVRVLTYPGGQELTPSRSLEVVSHSPSGFEWGYGGSGPAQLALAILLDYTDDPEVARAHYQAFKREVVSQLACTGPDGTWTLPAGEIEQWLPDD
ncbi:MULTISPECIES: DUF6166 domain-containing protein [Halolamina]|uniref:Uncharacterized protein n=1 Tax=Halolamina pelagica TaxID=699431 RepID=A0A1I5W228_9EURY|nr:MULTISPECIES: DUF6166 domain-containing protein [Halolamina]NHX36773.1 hypothetical protein [Halolamina sp. R1-12]SFQ13824.1 hypothetical protein SAMN05216277_12229 [Halolamina pelagica]